MTLRAPAGERSRTSASVTLSYVGVIVVVEAAARSIPATASVWINAGLIFLLLNHSAALHDRAGPSSTAASHALLALALIPVLKLVSAALPTTHLWLGVLPLLAAVPVAAALWALRSFPGWPQDNLVSTSRPVQLLFGLGGVPLGLACFLIARSEAPRASAHLHPASLLVALAAIWILGALLEEVVFRGAIQRALARVFGRWAIPLTACLFAAVYLGASRMRFALFMAGYGLLLSWWTYGSRSLLGAVVSHGLVLTGLVILGPHLRTHFFF